MCSANGDPVVHYSSLNRAGNPMPLNIEEVVIERENLHVSHSGGYNIFHVEYLLRNESDRAINNINYGFPIDYYVGANDDETPVLMDDDISESMYEIGWCNDMIRDVSFCFNEEKLTFHSAKESVRPYEYQVDFDDDLNETESEFSPGIMRRWFYTQFSIPARSKCILVVTYSVYAASEVDLFSFLSSPAASRYKSYSVSNKTEAGQVFFIDYDFQPAEHWGAGIIESLYITIDLSGFSNPCLKMDGYYFSTKELARYETNCLAKNIEPIKLLIQTSK